MKGQSVLTTLIPTFVFNKYTLFNTNDWEKSCVTDGLHWCQSSIRSNEYFSSLEQSPEGGKRRGLGRRGAISNTIPCNTREKKVCWAGRISAPSDTCVGTHASVGRGLLAFPHGSCWRANLTVLDPWNTKTVSNPEASSRFCGSGWWQRSVGFPPFQQAEEQMPPAATTHSVLALNQNSLRWDRRHYRFLLCKVWEGFLFLLFFFFFLSFPIGVEILPYLQILNTQV